MTACGAGTAGSIYALDCRSAEICRDMSATGFAFDRDRAVLLAGRLREIEDRTRQAADDACGMTIRRTKTGGFGMGKDDGLEHAFFRKLGAPVFFRSSLTGRPSLVVNALRGYAACADDRLRALSLAVLEWRRARKIRVTYVERPTSQLGEDGRIHPSWLSYGAVSGRWACQAPNLMNLPRRTTDPTAELGGVRSLYCARPGFCLVIFDAKQLEMRIAAYASGDPAMIRACESSDLHSANAEIIFGDAFTAGDKDARYKLRTCAKSSGFAVCYMAEAATVFARLVADGVPVQLRQVEAMLRKMKRGFSVYYEWQDRRLLDAIRTGFTDEPITGRTRYMGHEPSPTENANFPIQGGAAGLMNTRLPMICDELQRVSPATRIVGQCHDAGLFEAPIGDAEIVSDACKRIFERPVLITSSGRPIEASLPIDIEVTERWH